MKRRGFVHKTTLLSCGAVIIPEVGFSLDHSWKRITASEIDAPKIDFPINKRIPLGWKAFPVALQGEPTIIQFQADKVHGQNCIIIIRNELLSPALSKAVKLFG